MPRRHRFRNNSYFFSLSLTRLERSCRCYFNTTFRLERMGTLFQSCWRPFSSYCLWTHMFMPQYAAFFLVTRPVLTWPLQVMLMDLVNKDKNSGMPEPPVWATYQGLLDSSEGKKVRLLLINHHSSPQTTWYPGGGDPSGEVWVLQAGQGSLCSCPYWRDGAVWQHNTPERRAENIIHCNYIWTQSDWHLENVLQLN